MHEQVVPTPFAAVNTVLRNFREQIQPLLRSRFLGMYGIGSLALGDFDPASSDLDFIVVTNDDLDTPLVDGLHDIHAQFAASASPWAARIEAVYAPQAVLSAQQATTRTYPQIEKGTSLVQTPLEPGWVFQCWTLRERGLVIAGPHPQTFVAPIEPQAMDAAVVRIAGEWLAAAHHDPTWLLWLSERPHHLFVMQTLCRLLYSLATREVTSKPRAVQWAQQTLGVPWAALIHRSRTASSQSETLTQSEIEQTIAFIDFTVQQGQRAGIDSSLPPFSR